MTKFDGVIVGAGHNGLTLGAYMARCGLKIGVFERNAWIGGGCTTEEPILPGFRCNLHSNFYIGFSQAPLMRDLELARWFVDDRTAGAARRDLARRHRAHHP